MRGSSYTAHFWTCEDCSDTLKGVRNGVSIFLSTGYCIGTVMAMLLNFIIPEDADAIADKSAPEEEEDDLALKTEEPTEQNKEKISEEEEQAEA
jgi:hypothetical protein